MALVPFEENPRGLLIYGFWNVLTPACAIEARSARIHLDQKVIIEYL